MVTSSRQLQACAKRHSRPEIAEQEFKVELLFDRACNFSSVLQTPDAFIQTKGTGRLETEETDGKAPVIMITPNPSAPKTLKLHFIGKRPAVYD